MTPFDALMMGIGYVWFACACIAGVLFVAAQVIRFVTWMRSRV